MLPPRTARAFTLIELLAATALSTILMVAVLHAAAANRKAGLAMIDQSKPVWFGDLARVIHDDLVSARAFDQTGGSFAAITVGVYQPDTAERVGRPAYIHYRLDPEHHVLFREQQDLTTIPPTRSRQMLAAGITSFNLGPAQSMWTKADQPRQANRDNITEPGGQTELRPGAAVRLVLTTDDNTTYTHTFLLP